MLKFSAANAKIQSLSGVKAIQPYLANKRKVYSFDLLSGWSCPGAKDCLSKVHLENGKRTLKDGPLTQFRCFSASQEVVYTNTYNLRKNNLEEIKKLSKISPKAVSDAIIKVMPKNLGVCRIHVGGDFFNKVYFEAWIAIALACPNRLFYAYTKSLPYWIDNLEYLVKIPNLVLTASYGGRHDHLIQEHNLRHTKVIFHPSETNLEIDHDDSHAADPSKKDQNFALLIHGVQPKDSDASKALKVLKQEEINFAYSR